MDKQHLDNLSKLQALVHSARLNLTHQVEVEDSSGHQLQPLEDQLDLEVLHQDSVR